MKLPFLLGFNSSQLVLCQGTELLLLTLVELLVPLVLDVAVLETVLEVVAEPTTVPVSDVGASKIPNTTGSGNYCELMTCVFNGIRPSTIK